MTVRQVERFAARNLKPRPSGLRAPVDANTTAAIEELQRKFGTRVLIKPKMLGKPGQLVFEYYDNSDLTRIYDQLMQ